MTFEKEYFKFWQDFGKGKTMVLSTSLNDAVSSRMMSVVVIEEKLYFQTDNTLRKYNQLKGNNRVALCIDNVQIEGECTELGHPLENIDFCRSYKSCFPSSYERYSLLNNERLFAVSPTFIERWVYIDGIPHVEKFDVRDQKYMLEQYCGK